MTITATTVTSTASRTRTETADDHGQPDEPSMITALSTTGSRPGSRRAQQILVEQRLRAPARTRERCPQRRRRNRPTLALGAIRRPVWPPARPALVTATLAAR
jgi:hypothetical protein